MAKLEMKNEEGSDEDSSGAKEEEGSSNSEDSSDEGEEKKPKGVSNLIQIENPNRAPAKKANRKFVLFWGSMSIIEFTTTSNRTRSAESPRTRAN